MTYIAAADFRLGTLKSYTTGLALTEADGTNAYLDLVIASVTTQVELDLHDDFEPPNPDVDETLVTSGNGSVFLASTPPGPLADDGDDHRLGGHVHGADGLPAEQVPERRRDGDDRRPQAGHAPGHRRLRRIACWPDAPGSVELVGKFGWAAVPDDIKRLVSLRIYGLVKAKADPLTTIVQRTTIDAVITFGPSVEEREIIDRYARFAVMSA